MNYVEIGEVKISDKYYTQEICKALENGGYKTALIFDGLSERKVRILREEQR